MVSNKFIRSDGSVIDSSVIVSCKYSDQTNSSNNLTVGNAPAQTNSRAATDSDSEFIQAARSAGIDRTLEVLDKHMECIRALYPKEYSEILRMLAE